MIHFIEDEEILVKMVTLLLQKMRYQVQGFTDPKQAVRRYQTSPAKPLLVITDDFTLGENGVEVINAIRKLEPKQKVLLVSGAGYRLEDCRWQAYPDLLLPMPYNKATLLAAVKTLLKEDLAERS